MKRKKQVKETVNLLVVMKQSVSFCQKKRKYGFEPCIELKFVRKLDLSRNYT